MKKLNQVNKVFAVLGVAALLASVSVPSVHATAYNVKDANSREIILPQYVGAKVCRVAGSTTASKCTAAGNSGMLYALCTFGTTAVAGTGGMAFDSASAAGIASFDVADAFVAAYAISPIVIGTAYIATGVAVTPSSVGGCWVPSIPARYESGFVQRLNSTSLMAIALVRPDNGVNP